MSSERAAAERGRRVGFGERVRSALAAQRAPLWIILGTLLLATSSLTIGFSVDEYFQRVALSEHSALQGTERAPWQLFTFSTPQTNATLMEEGIFPWWTDKEFAVSFFRPLTSLTLYADHVLFGDNAVLFHAHSVIWYGLLLLAVWCVYRELGGSAQLPALALLLYAVDDARSQVVGWVSLRNAPMALIPAFLALVAHHRFRTGRGLHYAFLAPLGLALGLLGGEVAISVFGYLLAYAVFLDPGNRWWQRARTLVPYVAVIVIYRLVYHALGYGAVYSGMYIDPAREPLAFLHALVAHLPVLMFAQFALLPAELWEPYAMMGPWVQPAVSVLVLLGLALIVKLLWPVLRDSAEARFWAVGSVIAIAPSCGTFPADRLLIASSLGGAVLLARLLLSLFEAPSTRLRRGLGYLMVAMHLVFAPLFFTVRARDIVLTERLLGYADASVSRAPEIAQKTLIVINPILSAFGTYFPIYREVKGWPLPHAFRHLASAESPLAVERVDAHTLRLTPEGGFVSTASQRVFRSRFRSFKAGEQIALSDMTFTVAEISAEGMPTVLLVRLHKELEDPSLEWMQWRERAYAPFTPPKIGERVVLPKVDALPMLFSMPDAEE